MTEENKALVRRLVDEVVNQGRLEVADELFTPEGAAVAREAFTGFRSAFPDWREDIVDLVAEGDKVVGHFKCTGTLQGEFMGMPPHGQAHGG
jgi:predicted ester cyclase